MNRPENKQRKLPKDLSERLSTEFHLGDLIHSPYLEYLLKGKTIAEKVLIQADLVDKYSKKKWNHYCEHCQIVCNIPTHVCGWCQKEVKYGRCPCSTFEHTFVTFEEFKGKVRRANGLLMGPVPAMSPYTY